MQWKLQPTVPMENALDPGRKLNNGFFLYGIDMFSNDLTIYETVKLSASVYPDTTNTPFPLFDLAPMVAKIAAHPVFGH